MASQKKTPADIIEEKRLKKSRDELDLILSEENFIGSVYDRADIPLLKKQHVLGTIPKWIKDYDNSCETKIENARVKILNEFLIERAQEIIEEYKTFIHPEQNDDPANPKVFRVEPLPTVLGLTDDLTLLSYYQLVIESGEREGLALLSNKKFAQYATEGRKVVIGRDKANRAKLKKIGSKKEREKIHRKWQEAVNSLAKESPYSTYSWTSLSDEVGNRFRVTGRCVREHTENPFK